MALHPQSLRLFDYAAGVGMLSEGVRIALECIGIDSACVGYVERESHAAASIVARMEAKAIRQAPIWSDARTFDGAAWRGCVDGFVSGFPCQPYSLAGKRRGSGDDRDLWPDVHRTIDEMRPEFVFLENVGGLLSAGFDRVIEGLEGSGYAVAAGLFTAEEIGAPHKRERLFILGVSDADIVGRWNEGRTEWIEEKSDRRCNKLADNNGRGSIIKKSNDKPHESKFESPRRRDAGGCDSNMGDAGGEGFEGEPGGTDSRERGERTGSIGSAGGKLADAERPEPWGGIEGIEGIGRDRSANVGDELPIFAPGRNDWNAWRRVAELDPARMPAVEREFRGMADGLADRADRLRAVGNGVVPVAVAFGFLALWARLRDGAGS